MCTIFILFYCAHLLFILSASIDDLSILLLKCSRVIWSQILEQLNLEKNFKVKTKENF